MSNHITAKTKEPWRQCWATPPELFAGLHAELGFTIDGTARADNAKLPRFITEADDFFRQTFAGERVWLNPPYEDIPRFLAHAAQCMVHHGAFFGLLLPDRQDQRWHVDLYDVANEIAMLGRVKLIPPPEWIEEQRAKGKSGKSAPGGYNIFATLDPQTNVQTLTRRGKLGQVLYSETRTHTAWRPSVSVLTLSMRKA